MHSSRELSSSSFEIEVGGVPTPLEELFEGFSERDRLGVVLTRPCGAVGASALITATITAFYDIQRGRGPKFFIYPDYYLFHVGRPLGDHGRFDVWPRHKEVVVPADADRLLEAINDRGVTRLVVEDDAAGEPPSDPGALASARARVETCLAYSPSGRVEDADVRIAGNQVTEGYVEAILDPEARMARLRAEGEEKRADAIAVRAGEVDRDSRQRVLAGRRDLAEDGVPVESYRRIGLDEALERLTVEPGN
jgi:hypothetical protein